MGTCGCHWARGRREAPAAKVAAGGRIPLARHTLRAGRCRRTGRAYAPLHCSLAAALTVMGLRHRPQSGSCRDRARLPQTYAITGWDRRPQYEVRLRYPAPLAFRAQGLAKAESWQDLRAVHDSRSLCSEKGSLPGKIFTWCILQRRFAGLFGYMARRSCQSQLILNTRRRYIATKGPFSRPRPFLGYIGAEYCHRQTPRNA